MYGFPDLQAVFPHLVAPNIFKTMVHKNVGLKVCELTLYTLDTLILASKKFHTFEFIRPIS